MVFISNSCPQHRLRTSTLSSQLGLANMPRISSVPSPASATSSISNISSCGQGSFNSYASSSHCQTSLYLGFDEQPTRTSRPTTTGTGTSASYLTTNALSPLDAHLHPPGSTSPHKSTLTRMHHSRSSSNASSFRPVPPLSSISSHLGSTRSSSPFPSAQPQPQQQQQQPTTVQIPAYHQQQHPQLRSAPVNANSQQQSHPPAPGCLDAGLGGGDSSPPDGAENSDFLQCGGMASLEQLVLAPYEFVGAHVRRTRYSSFVV